jgi:cytochrome c553
MKTIQVLLMSGLFTVSAISTVQAGDAAAGEAAYLSKGCVGCHGPAGDSQAPEMFPKLSGLEEAYLATQLTAFRSGERAGPTMNPMASALTDEDIGNLATYLSAQK